VSSIGVVVGVELHVIVLRAEVVLVIVHEIGRQRPLRWKRSQSTFNSIVGLESQLHRSLQLVGNESVDRQELLASFPSVLQLSTLTKLAWLQFDFCGRIHLHRLRRFAELWRFDL
jgi:hypothetical protein